MNKEPWLFLLIFLAYGLGAGQAAIGLKGGNPGVSLLFGVVALQALMYFARKIK